jgi:predicted ATPase
VFEVIEPTGIRSPFEKAVASGLTPFVSREREVAQLIDRWRMACDGNGQVIEVSGEAGIGKSRLVQVLKEKIANEPHQQLSCRCSPYYQNSVLYPAIEFLQRFLRFDSDDDAGAKLTKLEDALAQDGLNLAETVPLFAALLSLPSGAGYTALPMSPQRQKQKTLEAIVEWLVRGAEQAHTNLIVEDLQWADPSTLELIDLLIERVAHARLLLILAFRPEFRAPWPARPQITSITLGRLPPAATELMIDSLTGGKQLPLAVISDIVAKTDGVPLFVEELTRMLLESGLLRDHESRYMLTKPVPALAIPSTLYDSLMARLDRLGSAKEVAQLAATIGREFSYELLRTIGPREETKLTGALNRLVDAELLDQKISLGRLRYRFRHALIRDAAYDSLLRSQRRLYHQRVALALRENFAEVVESSPELLATHLTEAGLSEEAIPYWQKAGQRALDQSADREAIEHLTKALELSTTLVETHDRLQEQLLLMTSLGTAFIATEGFSSREVERIYARARELSQRVGEAPQLFRVLFGMWLSHASRGQYRTALELGEQCKHVALATEDPGLLLEAHHVLGVSYICVAELATGIEHLEQAVATYDPHRDGDHAQVYGHDPAVVCLMHGSWAKWLMGSPDRALKMSEESLEQAQTLAHPSTLATVAAFNACLQQWCGNLRGVEQLSETAIAISTEHDFAYYRTMGCILAGWALVQSGQQVEGIGKMRSGVDAFRAMGGVILCSYFAGLLAEACGSAGRVEEAIAIMSTVDKDLEPWWKSELYRLDGELLLKLDEAGIPADSRRSQAKEYFYQALAIARDQKAKSLELRAAMSLTALLLLEDRLFEAPHLLAQVLESFSEGFETADLKQAKLLLKKL